MTETDRILRERAKELARPVAVAADADTVEVLEFVLAGVRFAAPTRFVRTVHPLDQLAPVPGTPSRVAGIMHLRGELLAVLDARALLGVDQSGIANFNKVVVLEQGAMAFGILVDSVDGVYALPDAQLRKPSGRLLGVTADGLAVIDAQALLRDESLIVNEQVTAGREQ